MSMTQIGISGLLASQSFLNTASNNIANAETEGYSRQRVNAYSTYSFFSGGGSLGTGVNTGSVERITNAFTTGQLWESQSWQAQTNTYAEYINELDQWLGSDNTSLSGGIDQFFTALNGASVNPFSSATRQVVIAESKGLSRQFNTLYNQINDQSELLGKQLNASVTSANSLLFDIALYNEQIQTLSSGPQAANELLDQRDEAIRKLSELMSVTVLEQPDGALNIYLQSGQSLVSGNQHNALSVTGGPQSIDGFGLTVQAGSAAQNLGKNVGGSMGGMIAYQTQVLNPSKNELGRLAVTLSDHVNKTLLAGEDLNGNAGTALFNDLTQPGTAYFPKNASSSAISNLRINDTLQLKADEYDLNVDASGNYSVTRLSDGVQVVAGFLSGAPTDVIAFDGIEIDINGSAVDQKYRIAPLRYAAREINVTLNDPAQLAFAALGGGAGDNSNLLDIIALQSAALVGGEKSLNEGYSQLVGNIAVQTAQAKTEAASGNSLLQQAETARSASSGVNLDEEAANLLRFQQMYSANAQVISVSRSTFDSLLRMF